MVEGGASRDFRRIKELGLSRPDGFAALIDAACRGHVAYLSQQIEAGAEAVQLFDSWAGVLPEHDFERWVIAPTRRITAALKERFPDVPLIGFPRGAGLLYERYAAESGVDAVGSTRPCRWGSRATAAAASRRCRAISIRRCCWSAVRR